MKMPSVDDLYIAAQWLEIYEGAEDAESCRKVAVWLREKADAKEFQQTCKQAGVSVAEAKKAVLQHTLGADKI